jgi:hypothetical protein
MQGPEICALIDFSKVCSFYEGIFRIMKIHVVEWYGVMAISDVN